MPVVLLLHACSDNIRLAAPYREFTVVYGFLDLADTAHYIRIQKAFLDESKNALIMAQNPDSSFDNRISVSMVRVNFSGSPSPDTIRLRRVDLNLEGYAKQPGVFFNAPNYAYKFTDHLDPGYIYQLIVSNPVTGETDSAQSPVIIDTSANVFFVDILDEFAPALDFASLSSQHPNVFEGGYINPFTDFNFNGQSTPVGVATMVIRFNWVDSDALSHSLTRHSYDYNIGYTAPAAHFSFSVLNEDFYSALSAAMGNAPANTYRLLDICDVSAYLGTQDFYYYQQATLSEGLGLTGSAIEPNITNIRGKHAVGLFTGRGNRTGKVRITDETIDSLKMSSYMAHTHIAGTVYH